MGRQGNEGAHACLCLWLQDYTAVPSLTLVLAEPLVTALPAESHHPPHPQLPHSHPPSLPFNRI